MLPPGVKGLWHPHMVQFLDNFIEIWIKFGFYEKWKGMPHTQVYFQAGCINVLRIAV